MGSDEQNLPDFTRAGSLGEWEFTDRYGSEAGLRGHFLGMGSSHRPYHKHAFPPYAAPKQHCSTCRWMELRLFQETGGEERYLLVRTGRSDVPGEETRTSFGWSETAADVVSALVTWTEDGASALGYVERRALEQATAYDDDLHAAYARYRSAPAS